MAYLDSQPANGYPKGSGNDGGSGDDSIIFVVEHLSTFTVSAQNGVVYPFDGMRRLLQLEKTSGIWTQKVMLRLDRAWVTILDYENGEIMERFQLSMIHEPTAFTSKEPKDLYKNILIFIVSVDPVHRNPPEMHIFQCLEVSSKFVVQDLKMYMAGYFRLASSKATGITPPFKKPSTEPLSGPNNVGFVRTINDDAGSTSSEHYENDITAMNHCFDDIERFIARLQHVAVARRELEQRRKSLKNNKKKVDGDEMLTTMACPPSNAEYISIFQKFKLSFNLLAKLKLHIHDPNAPELVHFLFSPLKLIVELSQKSAAVSNLPFSVIQPLLSHDAVELLSDCLSSKETEFWHSLGDAWNTPKEKWNGYAIPYIPTFMDGWLPDASLFVEEKKDKRPGTEITRYSTEFYGYSSDRGVPDRRSDLLPFDFSSPSEISNDSIDKNANPAGPFERQQRRWLAQLKANNAEIVQVTYPRTAKNDKELTVIRGEYLEVLDNSRKWWKARNMLGQEAHVPYTIVTLLLHDDDFASLPSSAD